MGDFEANRQQQIEVHLLGKSSTRIVTFRALVSGNRIDVTNLQCSPYQRTLTAQRGARSPSRNLDHHGVIVLYCAPWCLECSLIVAKLSCSHPHLDLFPRIIKILTNYWTSFFEVDRPHQTERRSECNDLKSPSTKSKACLQQQQQAITYVCSLTMNKCIYPESQKSNHRAIYAGDTTITDATPFVTNSSATDFKVSLSHIVPGAYVCLPCALKDKVIGQNKRWQSSSAKMEIQNVSR